MKHALFITRKKHKRVRFRVYIAAEHSFIVSPLPSSPWYVINFLPVLHFYQSLHSITWNNKLMCTNLFRSYQRRIAKKSANTSFKVYSTHHHNHLVHVIQFDLNFVFWIVEFRGCMLRQERFQFGKAPRNRCSQFAGD